MYALAGRPSVVDFPSKAKVNLTRNNWQFVRPLRSIVQEFEAHKSLSLNKFLDLGYKSS